MIDDAEKFRKEDEEMEAKVLERNNFENYCYQIKMVIEDKKLKGSFTNADKRGINEVAAEGLAWLEKNEDASSEMIVGMKALMATKYNPIMVRVYEEAGCGPFVPIGEGNESK